MKRVVDYKIVVAEEEDLNDLESEVKENLTEGWQPLGAPFEGGKDRSYLAQALVKYDG